MPKENSRGAAARRLVQRANRPIAPLLNVLLVQPREFADRIRENIRLRRNPRRLRRCIDDLEEALRHRGIEMRAYFSALRRELSRYDNARTNGRTNGHTTEHAHRNGAATRGLP